MKAFFVSKRLAFGSAIKTRAHAKQLKTLGITHVINLRRSGSQQIRKFSNLWVPFPDDMKPRPRWFYKRTLKFFRKTMGQPDAKLFVMCHHGICRSASLAYFFLRHSGKSRIWAERRIKTARPTARVVPAYRQSGEKYLERIKRT